MKGIILYSTLAILYLSVCGGTSKQVHINKYPNKIISNNSVQMRVFLPDKENGLYRAARFDWSGVIGSVKYEEHEYFGYWKDSQDPFFHEDLPGPVEGFLNPGLGYADAKPGENFIRIGVGIIEKPDETNFNFRKSYAIVDHGKWTIESGKDWIRFKHEISSDFGYAYEYIKTIELKENGFLIKHNLQNNGEKPIETDQFNHNFLMIDGEKSGPAFKISFPYPISTENSLGNLLEIEGNDLYFINEVKDTNLFLLLNGYSNLVKDHKVTVVNQKSGAGVSFSVDKPLYRMAFWTCKTTLCPENFIWISVKPGKNMEWISDYSLFVE